MWSKNAGLPGRRVRSVTYCSPSVWLFQYSCTAATVSFFCRFTSRVSPELSIFAAPRDEPCRHTGNHRIRLDAAGDDGASRHDRAAPDTYAIDDDDARAQPAILLDDDTDARL